MYVVCSTLHMKMQTLNPFAARQMNFSKSIASLSKALYSEKRDIYVPITNAIHNFYQHGNNWICILKREKTRNIHTKLSFFFFISIASTILNNSQNILTNFSRSFGENVGDKGMYKSANPTIKKQSTEFKRESTMLYISHADTLRMRKTHWLCIHRCAKKHKQMLNGRMMTTL